MFVRGQKGGDRGGVKEGKVARERGGGRNNLWQRIDIPSFGQRGEVCKSCSLIVEVAPLCTDSPRMGTRMLPSKTGFGLYYYYYYY